MEILTSIGGDLRHGETHKLNMGYFFFFEVEFDLEGQGPSPPSTKEILIKVYYTFGPNLVILAWTGPELSRGQANDWNTDWHTHRDTHTHRRRRWHTQRPKLASGNKIVARGCDTITSKTIEWGKSYQKHWFITGTAWSCFNAKMLPTSEEIWQTYYLLSPTLVRQHCSFEAPASIPESKL